MPKKRFAKGRRTQATTTPLWRDSVDVDNRDYRPRGDDESLRQAVGLLKPEESDRDAAGKEIYAIAQRFNALAAVAISAPRFKQIEARLLVLRDAYARLTHELNTLDSATLNEIHDPRARNNPQLYMLAGANWLREPHVLPFIEGSELEFESPLIRASAMVKHLDRVIEVFGKRRRTNRGAVDRGGQENIFRAMYGHEKEDLVRACADLFDKYGLGNRITSTQTGPFFCFVSHVYDFAVGEASEGESRGLADPIKKFIREYKKLMAEVNLLVNRRWR
jgi:hypothetical protein